MKSLAFSKVFLQVFLFTIGPAAFAQINNVAQASQLRKSNAIIYFQDGKKLKANIQGVTPEYLMAELEPYNSPAEIHLYYLRPLGSLYRVDAAYIKKVVVPKGRQVLGAMLVAGAALGLAGGYAGSKLPDKNGDNNNPVSTLIGAGLGAGLGIAGGSIAGLVKRRSVYINGEPARLADLRKYY